MSRSEEFEKGHMDKPIGLEDDGYDYIAVPGHANPVEYGVNNLSIHRKDDLLGRMQLRPDGVVDHVLVSPEHRRQGHATRLWDAAKYLSTQFENWPEPQHSPSQTPEGKKWAKAVDARKQES